MSQICFSELESFFQLELDFEFLHKDSLLKLDIEYPKLEKFILHKLREVNPDNLYDDFSEHSLGEFVLMWLRSCDISCGQTGHYQNVFSLPAYRSAFIFKNFSKLWPSQHLTTVKGCQWKPNRTEMRDGFLLEVKVRVRGNCICH